MYKRILVTGGAGYIGTVLIKKLQEKYPKTTIRVLDRNYNPSIKNVEYIISDIKNRDIIKSAIKNVDLIFHLAAEVGAEKSFMSETNFYENNFFGTLNITTHKKVIFPSTVNIYGKTNKKNLNENDNPAPIYPYAISKYFCEKYLDLSVIGRLSTNYGWSPSIRFNLVLNKFVLNAIQNKPLEIHGDGNTWRPFVHVEDSANALIWLSEQEKKEIYNVGGENIQIKDLAKLIKKVTKSDSKIVFKNRPSPFSYHVSFKKIKKAGFKTKWNLKKGIKDLAEHLKYIRLQK